ncbi:lysophospholipase L1-like esterase [Kitasatospora gansuensis]|uniref:Lysophospholipase L1-like esterase n=1 Tax=Kitasatospora gansuensis TaxID=258050 RepID=A0A7W7WKQ8_9ACTN|nr:SGNH/GDSL hydrolase family protein [Kitasatospora gansuensis]MBB4950235.1 lysophospholipase L1-like esterase [Kitasatospora gansuensis]
MFSHARKRLPALLGGLLATAALAALTAPAAHAGTGAGPYVALGDSFAAGALVPNQSGGLCLRSDQNYGHLVAAALNSTSYTDVTCSAAKVKHLTEAQYGVYEPQLNALKPDTALVTLGIGGNDLGVSDLGVAELIATCVGGAVVNPFGTPCKDVYADGHWAWRDWQFQWVYGEDKLRSRIAAAAPQVADGLRRIHAKSPNAKVLLVGYPSVVPSNGANCIGRQPVTPGDVEYLHGVLSDLNAMLARTAAANGATYVDTATPTKGHDACSDTPWIEGLLPQSPAAPFHPNAAGERVMADTVLRTLGH